MGEKAVKVSNEVYDLIRKVAEATGQGIRETADQLVRDNSEKFNEIGRFISSVNVPSEDDEESPVIVREMNHMDYRCFDCGYPVSYDEKPEVCPGCGVKLDWEEIIKNKPTWLGWLAVGLLILGMLSTAGSVSQRQIWRR